MADWFTHRPSDSIDPSFNKEEFIIPDEDYDALLEIIHDTPIPNSVRVQKRHRYFVQYIEPARKGGLYVDRIQDETLTNSPKFSNQQSDAASLRIMTWPERRILLKQSELPKVIKNLMDTEAEWDGMRGWIIPGVNQQTTLLNAVIAGLRVRYLGVKTSITQNTLKMKGYFEKPLPPNKGGAKKRFAARHAAAEGDGGDEGEQSGPKKKAPVRPQNIYSTRGGPMPDEHWERMMNALATNQFHQNGVNPSTAAGYERVWICFNKQGLPEVDKLQENDGEWGLYHVDTDRIVIKESDMTKIVEACVRMGYTSKKDVFEFLRDSFCVSRDRLDEWTTAALAARHPGGNNSRRTPATGPGGRNNNHGGGRNNNNGGSARGRDGDGSDDDEEYNPRASSANRRGTRAIARSSPNASGGGRPGPSTAPASSGSKGRGPKGQTAAQSAAMNANVPPPKGKKKIKVSVVYEHSGYVANSSEDEWMDDEEASLISNNVARYPMQFVQIECVPTENANYSNKTYAYILVVRCTFSGYIFARAIPDTDRGLLCRHLMDIFGNFGPPKGFYSGNTEPKVVKDCIDDVEQLFRVTIKNMGRDPPKTPRTLMMTFRDRCYEKARESFMDVRRWVEILPYTVMEFNQRVQRDSKLSSFEVMFAREPWEGEQLPPWITGGDNSVMNKSGLFLTTNLKEMMTVFMKIQKKIRGTAGGAKIGEACRNTKCQTEDMPPCRECRKANERNAKMEIQLQKVQSDLKEETDKGVEMRKQIKALTKEAADARRKAEMAVRFNAYSTGAGQNEDWSPDPSPRGGKKGKKGASPATSQNNNNNNNNQQQQRGGGRLTEIEVQYSDDGGESSGYFVGGNDDNDYNNEDDNDYGGGNDDNDYYNNYDGDNDYGGGDDGHQDDYDNDYGANNNNVGGGGGGDDLNFDRDRGPTPTRPGRGSRNGGRGGSGVGSGGGGGGPSYAEDEDDYLPIKREKTLFPPEYVPLRCYNCKNCGLCLKPPAPLPPAAAAAAAGTAAPLPQSHNNLMAPPAVAAFADGYNRPNSNINNKTPILPAKLKAKHTIAQKLIAKSKSSSASSRGSASSAAGPSHRFRSQAEEEERQNGVHGGPTHRFRSQAEAEEWQNGAHGGPTHRFRSQVEGEDWQNGAHGGPTHRFRSQAEAEEWRQNGAHGGPTHRFRSQGNGNGNPSGSRGGRGGANKSKGGGGRRRRTSAQSSHDDERSFHVDAPRTAGHAAGSDIINMMPPGGGPPPPGESVKIVKPIKISLSGLPPPAMKKVIAAAPPKKRKRFIIEDEGGGFVPPAAVVAVGSGGTTAAAATPKKRKRKPKYYILGDEFIPKVLSQNETKYIRSRSLIDDIVVDVVADLKRVVVSKDEEPNPLLQEEYLFTDEWLNPAQPDFVAKYGLYPDNPAIWYHPESDTFCPPCALRVERLNNSDYCRHKREMDEYELLRKLNRRRVQENTRAKNKRTKGPEIPIDEGDVIVDTLEHLLDTVVSEEEKDKRCHDFLDFLDRDTKIEGEEEMPMSEDKILSDLASFASQSMMSAVNDDSNMMTAVSCIPDLEFDEITSVATMDHHSHQPQIFDANSNANFNVNLVKIEEPSHVDDYANNSRTTTLSSNPPLSVFNSPHQNQNHSTMVLESHHVVPPMSNSPIVGSAAVNSPIVGSAAAAPGGNLSIGHVSTIPVPTALAMTGGGNIGHSNQQQENNSTTIIGSSAPMMAAAAGAAGVVGQLSAAGISIAPTTPAGTLNSASPVTMPTADPFASPLENPSLIVEQSNSSSHHSAFATSSASFHKEASSSPHHQTAVAMNGGNFHHSSPSRLDPTDFIGFNNNSSRRGVVSSSPIRSQQPLSSSGAQLEPTTATNMNPLMGAAVASFHTPALSVSPQVSRFSNNNHPVPVASIATSTSQLPSFIGGDHHQSPAAAAAAGSSRNTTVCNGISIPTVPAATNGTTTAAAAAAAINDTSYDSGYSTATPSSINNDNAGGFGGGGGGKTAACDNNNGFGGGVTADNSSYIPTSTYCDGISSPAAGGHHFGVSQQHQHQPSSFITSNVVGDLDHHQQHYSIHNNNNNNNGGYGTIPLNSSSLTTTTTTAASASIVSGPPPPASMMIHDTNHIGPPLLLPSSSIPTTTTKQPPYPPNNNSNETPAAAASSHHHHHHHQQQMLYNNFGQAQHNPMGQ